MPVLLVLVLVIFGLPPNTMMELAAIGKPFHTASPAFMLGAPSMGFYALLATFGLGLAAFGRIEGRGAMRRVEDGTDPFVTAHHHRGLGFPAAPAYNGSGRGRMEESPRRG